MLYAPSTPNARGPANHGWPSEPALYQIQYQCRLRDCWYDYGEPCWEAEQAISAAQGLAYATGRKMRVVDEQGVTVWVS
jgi:hypothetical protein